MKKKLIQTVDLVFFEDDAHGEWGITHKETYDANDGNGFNAFWSAIGIFHDVFEHAHEFTHKYFQGDYAMNLGGECAAMGAMWYYIQTLGIRNRYFNDNMRWDLGESLRATTKYEIHEAISDGNCRYGSTFESNVPKQRPLIDDQGLDLEEVIKDYWEEVKDLTYQENKYSREINRETSAGYKKSLTYEKLANLHRYGYRMAMKLVPDTQENLDTLSDFIDFWDQFTQRNRAEDIGRLYEGMTFKIYREGTKISWEAFLTRNVEGYPDYQIRGLYFDYLELFTSEGEYAY